MRGQNGVGGLPPVHRLDAAVLFRLVLEKAPAGSVPHGAAETGVTMKGITETIGRGLGLPTVLDDLEQGAHLTAPAS
ncbi:hypothetical protein [Streptomyces sp. CNZ748]|uniref:hypothetical protein n=1 Tax=unclassified Streptomyces TaxID=2593676 RepID=UPI0035A90B15